MGALPWLVRWALVPGQEIFICLGCSGQFSTTYFFPHLNLCVPVAQQTWQAVVQGRLSLNVHVSPGTYIAEELGNSARSYDKYCKIRDRIYYLCSIFFFMLQARSGATERGIQALREQACSRHHGYSQVFLFVVLSSITILAYIILIYPWPSIYHLFFNVNNLFCGLFV